MKNIMEMNSKSCDRILISVFATIVKKDIFIDDSSKSSITFYPLLLFWAINKRARVKS